MAYPWLSIIGIHPSGLQSLSAAAVQVFGSPRHLALAQVGGRGRAWPVPFSVEPLLQLRGQQKVAMLVSGDPFHFGGGASVARHLERGEWRNHPQPSTFSWISGELGWSQEQVHCLGLHARSLSSLTPLLAPHERFICLLRDGPAAHTLAQWLLQHAEPGDQGLRVQLAQSKRQIAAHLGIAPETLSRVLRQLRDQGLLDGLGKNLWLPQPESLRQLAKA